MVDSPSSSAGSSFRELDDVFLQTQTRIWLGEVLGTRLNEDLLISDLLQDGEILFEVSKVLWNLLLTKKELRHLKHKFRPFGSKKISRRYRPYSNIDSFLKICKILGLSGIDLFSPSDVVEKKNTRKVCICIRALSKKARSKVLTVPDFNVVRYSVPMSTDMVGILRRSLESPQCTVSTSSSNTTQKGSLIKSKQKNLYGKTNGDDDSSSDESDEAESRYMGENSLYPSGKLNFCSYQENSPETHSLSQCNRRNNTVNSNFNHALEKDYSGDSSCTSVGENNYISEYLKFSDLMVHANNGDGPLILDGEKNMFDFFLNINSQESGRRSSHNKFYDDDDIEVSSTTSMSSVLGRLLNLELDHFDEDESLSSNIYSYESKEHEAEKDSPVLSEQPNMDSFERQSDTVLDQEAESKLTPVVLLGSTKHFPSCQENRGLSCPEPLASELCGPHNSNPENNGCPKNRDVNQETLLGEDTDETVIRCSESDVLRLDNQISDVSSNELTVSCDGESDRSDRSGEQLHNVNIEGNFSNQHIPSDISNGTSIVPEDTCATIMAKNSCLLVKDENLSQEDAHVLNSIQDNNVFPAENGSQDNKEHELHVQEENKLDGRQDASADMPSGKRHQRPLLETVAKGTAIAGVLFLLLQIRKIKGHDAEIIQPRAQVPKKNGIKFSFTKLHMGSIGKGRYPSDRIRL